MTLHNLSEYHKPGDLAEALRLLRRATPRTVPLGGGTVLIGQGGDDIEAVVDLKNLGLNTVDSYGLTLGATATLQQLCDHSVLGETVLAGAARHIAGRNIRNQATVGGEIAAGDWRSPLLAVLLSQWAHVTIQSDEVHTVSLSDWLADRAKWLGPGALITEVALAVLPEQYASVARTPSDYPIVCAAATENRLALAGVAAIPVCFDLDPAAGIDAALAGLALDPPGDHFGSSDYRREVAMALARRVLAAVWRAS